MNKIGVCKICKKTFRKTTNNNVYCSDECRAINHKRMNKKNAKKFKLKRIEDNKITRSKIKPIVIEKWERKKFEIVKFLIGNVERQRFIKAMKKFNIKYTFSYDNHKRKHCVITDKEFVRLLNKAHKLYQTRCYVSDITRYRWLREKYRSFKALQ